MPTDDGTENVTDVPGQGVNVVAELLPAFTGTFTVIVDVELVDGLPQSPDTMQ